MDTNLQIVLLYVQIFGILSGYLHSLYLDLIK